MSDHYTLIGELQGLPICETPVPKQNKNFENESEKRYKVFLVCLDQTLRNIREDLSYLIRSNLSGNNEKY